VPSSASHQLTTNNRRVCCEYNPGGITTTYCGITDAGQLCSSQTPEAHGPRSYSVLVWTQICRPATSGEPFDPRRLTAAAITLPLGSVVKVENPKNGRSVRVRINDCGPFVRGRSLDLSRRAAQKIGISHHGVTRVKVTIVKTPSGADIDRCSR